jgi:hypothetical protein
VASPAANTLEEATASKASGRARAVFFSIVKYLLVLFK